MIYKTLNENQFIDEFEQSGTYADNFTYEGFKALFNFLDDVHHNDSIELDIIELCCEFEEYESFDELISSYDEFTTLEEIENQTVVLETDSGGYVIQQF